MKFEYNKKTGIGKRAAVGAFAVVGLAGLLALAGCATTGAAPGSEAAASSVALTPEQQIEIVKKRSQERWNAMIARDYVKAWEYLSPATRALVPKEQYAAHYAKAGFRKVEINDAKCEEDACLVRFNLTYDYKNFKDVTTPAAEKWIFVDGQAWFNPRE
ncbi:MAG: hypothetical protein LBB65_02920 [Burkholderiales bacterium]|jgi:hypothetical protein|nr:hypothetical protein [Burkholderiales bacterium]